MARKLRFYQFSSVAFLMIFYVQGALAAAPQVLLECKGQNSRGFPIEHEIAIYKNFAEFDGKRFSLEQSATEFVLKGSNPITAPAPWTIGQPHANDVIIYINRLTGEYAMTPASPNGDINATEDSGKNEGCKKMPQKF